jgi:hypothetical protein
MSASSLVVVVNALRAARIDTTIRLVPASRPRLGTRG